jgi:glycylpeptide N-tetradecanoyltransferase
VTATPWEQLLNDAVIMAGASGFDVFNALDVLENSDELLTRLKFGEGDGVLHYYLDNWNGGQELDPDAVGLILV